MSLKMSEFHGIDPKHVATLRGAGIENTDDLMKIWSDKEKRAGLVASTGIAEDQFMKFAAMARLGRVKGMDLRHLGALVAAGIDGPKRLFRHTPETLMKHLVRGGGRAETDAALSRRLRKSAPGSRIRSRSRTGTWSQAQSPLLTRNRRASSVTSRRAFAHTQLRRSNTWPIR